MFRRNVLFAIAFTLLAAPALSAPPTSTERGTSWGHACNKQHRVPKGKKCGTNENCPSCCLGKYNKCYGENRSDRLRKKCDESFRTCLVTVSNPNLNVLTVPDPFSVPFGTSAPSKQAPKGGSLPGRVPSRPAPAERAPTPSPAGPAATTYQFQLSR